MKQISNKTRAMLDCESRYNMPIEEILRMMYVDYHLSHNHIAKELNISFPTVISWLHMAGIYSRKLNL